MVLRRLRRALSPRPVLTVEPTPDQVPKRGFFAEPIRVSRIDVLEPEVLEDGGHRVTFRVEIRDIEDKRCSELAVDARITGPETTRVVQPVTDLFGRVKIRMSGPPGTYRLEVLEVAAKGLDWDPQAGPTTAETHLTG